MAVPESIRFWAKVEKGPVPEYRPDLGPCWLWTGCNSGGKDKTGYGQFWPTPYVPIGAHRWAYTKLAGLIPPGLDLDHLCRVPRCVNPGHLEPVTRQINLQRGIGNAGKLCCIQGHPFDYVNVKGYRVCRRCKATRKEAWRDRVRQRGQRPS
jgi:hypothetical protein